MLFRRVVSCTAEINFFLFISRGKGIYKDWNILTFPPFLICHYTCNFKSYTTYFKKNSLECSYIRASIDIFACKQINVKFQYLSWMLNNIYCVPDVKESLKHVYIVYFHVQKDWKGEKRNAIDSCFSVNEARPPRQVWHTVIYYIICK